MHLSCSGPGQPNSWSWKCSNNTQVVPIHNDLKSREIPAENWSLIIPVQHTHVYCVDRQGSNLVIIQIDLHTIQGDKMWTPENSWFPFYSAITADDEIVRCVSVKFSSVKKGEWIDSRGEGCDGTTAWISNQHQPGVWVLPFCNSKPFVLMPTRPNRHGHLRKTSIKQDSQRNLNSWLRKGSVAQSHQAVHNCCSEKCDTTTGHITTAACLSCFECIYNVVS